MLKSDFNLIIFVYNLMVGYSNKEWRKLSKKILFNTGTETWVKIYPRVCTNQPSNNWAQVYLIMRLMSPDRSKSRNGVLFFFLGLDPPKSLLVSSPLTASMHM